MEKTCSFCGNSKSNVDQFVQGKGANICNTCVSISETVLEDKSIQGWVLSTEKTCLFCDRESTQSIALQFVTKQDTAAVICKECIQLCKEVLDESEAISGVYAEE